MGSNRIPVDFQSSQTGEGPAEKSVGWQKEHNDLQNLGITGEQDIAPDDTYLLELERNLGGTYEFLKVIGSGGMGTVYKARHKALDKLVAIKIVNGCIVSDKTAMRFRVEGKAASRLAHPAVVQVFDLNVTDAGHPYLIMEYIDGVSLDSILKHQGSLNFERFIQLFVQVCDGLVHAHEHSVLHRDIKPSNIVVAKGVNGREHCKLLDFGTAKLLDDTGYGAGNLTKTGDAVGTPLYMSPEQGFGTEVDTRSDIYSIGCAMYEAITGAPPFVGKTAYETLYMHRHNQPLPLAEASMGKSIPPQLQPIIFKCLEKEPDDRYKSVSVLCDDLKNASDGAIESKAPESKQLWKNQSDLKFSQNSIVTATPWKLVALSVVAIIVLAAGLWQFLSSGSSQTAISNKPEDGSDFGVGANADLDRAMKEVPAVANAADLGSGPVLHDIKMQREQKTAKLALSLGGPDVDDVVMQKLKDADADSLRELDLSGTSVSSSGLQVLNRFHNLEDLNLSQTNVSSLDAIHEMPKLQILRMKGCKLQLEPVDAIKHIVQVFPNLTYLLLSKTNITNDDLTVIEGLTKLRRIDLHGCTALTRQQIFDFRLRLPRLCDVRYGLEHGLFIDALEDQVDSVVNGSADTLISRINGAIKEVEEMHTIKSGTKRAALAELWTMLARAKVKEGQDDSEALGAVGNLAAKNSLPYADMQTLLAHRAESKGDYETAIACRKRAAELYDALKPNSAREYYDVVVNKASNVASLGQDYGETQDSIQAKLFLEKALRYYDYNHLNYPEQLHEMQFWLARAEMNAKVPDYEYAVDACDESLKYFQPLQNDLTASILTLKARISIGQSNRNVRYRERLQAQAAAMLRRARQCKNLSPKTETAINDVEKQLLS